MVSREECESKGMVFVAGHKDWRGRYIHAHCRKISKARTIARIEREEDMRHTLKYGASNLPTFYQDLNVHSEE